MSPEPSAEPPYDAAALARALLDARVLGHPVPRPEVVETHISCVALTGEFAYKLRKPVQLPFVDFRSLEQRRTDCERELELNRRWAPQLYLAVVAIRGSVARPTLEGDEPVIDYAVKMRQFPREAQLDEVVAAGGLDERLVAALADTVADMHERAPRADPEGPYGRVEVIGAKVDGNLDALRSWHSQHEPPGALETIDRWSHDELDRLRSTFEERRLAGHVRECHGDLHLANLVRLDGEIVPFDCVEFEASFRWVDVISDLAFLLMDLEQRARRDAAYRLLDRYLQRSGDYDALRVLRCYLVYRALVRAKVAVIRMQQLDRDDADRDRLDAEAARYLRLALRLREPPPAPPLVITHGLSGSGKSWLAARLAPALGGVCLRSDVERARLFEDGPERYSRAATERTYARLAALAELVIGARYPVVVDATFIERERRAAMAALAARLGVPFRILAPHAPRAVLERRISERLAQGRDASQADRAVLAHQIERLEPLTRAEEAVTIAVDSVGGADMHALASRLHAAR